MSLTDQIKSTIRDVPDYPKPGILFKDITPVLSDPGLSRQIAKAMAALYRDKNIDIVAGIEARGFIFGAILAHEMGCGFVPVRKAGKLPYQTRSEKYGLEYGTSEIEVHVDAFSKGARVLIHDDVLATGGTACAAGRLVAAAGAEIAGFSFLINLGFLPGAERVLKEFGLAPDFLIKY